MVNPSTAFWRGKKVLLTGHTGFKGAWLALWLERMGAEVSGLALAPETDPNLASLTGFVDKQNFYIGDIRDPGIVQDIFSRSAPDIVLHLAAQALVRRSYREPVETFAANVMGTLHVLKSATESLSVRAALMVTTDKCYENKEWLWPYRENEALGGHDPYSASKACAEIAAAAWRSSLKDMPLTDGRKQPLHIATARAGNVIGGGDWAEDRLIPDFIRALSAGEELLIRRPNATRPWQHVLEPLCGYLLLAEKLWQGEACEAWNFGPSPDDVRPVRWIVEKLSTAWGKGARWRVLDGDHPHEAALLALDASKARTQLGWRPRLPLATALEWTCNWHSRHLSGDDARTLVHEQIEQYLALSNEREL